MALPLNRFLGVAVFAAAAAFCTWKYLPSTEVERVGLEYAIRSFANPPFYIGGKGTDAEPWTLRTVSSKSGTHPEFAPSVLSIGDDPDRIFQASPPSPVDFAIILKNLRRLGIERPAISAVMDWESPDVIALTALDAELGGFSSITTAVPLTRGATPDALPPAFRRASISVEDAIGDVSLLPAVNRVPLPNAILGGENAYAGFTTLEAGGPENALVARWENRIVFSFPLLAVIRELDVPIDQVEVRPGSHIRLGTKGPVVLIDAYGRPAIPIPEVTPAAIVAAEDLILTDDPLPDARPFIVRDDQSQASTSTQNFSENLAATVAAVAADRNLTPAQSIERLSPRSELVWIGGVVLLLAGLGMMRRFPAEVLYGIFLAVAVTVQLGALSFAHLWLPGSAWIGGILAAACIRGMLGDSQPKPEPEPEPEPAKKMVPRSAKKSSRKPPKRKD